MIKKSLIAAMAALALPSAINAHAVDPSYDEVVGSVEKFFEALRSEDKTALAKVMIPEATIFVHNRTGDDHHSVQIVSVADHLERWSKGTAKTDEFMNYQAVLIDGDMAQVWGPYVFTVDGKATHCGVNALSLVKQEDGWKVGNTSFSMEPVSKCKSLGAPEVPE